MVDFNGHNMLIRSDGAGCMNAMMEVADFDLARQDYYDGGCQKNQ